MPRGFAVACALAVAAAVGAGCGGPLRVSERVYLHSLTANDDGSPRELRVKFASGVERVADFARQVQDIVDTDAFRRAKRVLVFIHGGLNSHAAGRDRVERDLPRMDPDPEMRDTYPIFINWDARLETSVWHHVLWQDVRGNLASVPGQLLLFPYHLATDLGAVACLSPYALGEYLVRATQSTFSRYPEPPASWQDQVIWSARYDPSAGDRAWAAVRSLLLPIRIVTLIFARWLVVPSYDFLYARTDALFRSTTAANAGVPKPGVLLELMRKIPADKAITLVGHSMGCIVANELLRRFKDRRFDRIIFMGAACTIRDFTDAVPDYLASDAGRDTRFHSLHLHPVAEAREAMAGGVLPYGSLLEQLDAYVLFQRSAFDGTLGKWRNMREALKRLATLPADVRARMWFRVFPVIDDRFPVEHGDFDNFAYWQQAFYWGIPRPRPVRRDAPPTACPQQAQRLGKR